MIDSQFAARHVVGVNFSHITTGHGNQIILDNVSAKAPPGGATVLIGPNGAGKTTLLRCLLSERKYSGQIRFFDGKGDFIASPVLGYVPQILQADAHLPLRVYEFMALAQTGRPLWLGCSRIHKKRSRELLELVAAEKLENRRLGELSGGEMRRVLLASALGRKPDLLALDEAEAGVDYRGERLFWQLLDNSRKELGFTLLMVSHNLSLAAHYATHVICIKKTVIAQGQPKTILTASTLEELFGVPIHLYPEQCQKEFASCDECGAYGNLPHYEQNRIRPLKQLQK